MTSTYVLGEQNLLAAAQEIHATRVDVLLAISDLLTFRRISTKRFPTKSAMVASSTLAGLLDSWAAVQAIIAARTTDAALQTSLESTLATT